MTTKYVIELGDDVQFVAKVGVTASGNAYSLGEYKADLEELNYDYINDHYGSLQDDAYQRGLEDGKAVNDKGCEGCKYQANRELTCPCSECANNFRNQWTAKKEEIGVGDVVETKGGTIFAVTRITADGLVVGFTGDGSACCFNITKITKTGEHYNINEILGGLCDD